MHVEILAIIYFREMWIGKGVTRRYVLGTSRNFPCRVTDTRTFRSNNTWQYKDEIQEGSVHEQPKSLEEYR